MSDEKPFIPNRNAKGYRDMRTPLGQERLMFSPHYIYDNGPRVVHPASGMTIGSMRAIGSDEYQPTVRIDHAAGPTSLLFIPTEEELRALGEAFISTADHMRAAAADMLAAALRKRDPNT